MNKACKVKHAKCAQGFASSHLLFANHMTIKSPGKDEAVELTGDNGDYLYITVDFFRD